MSEDWKKWVFLSKLSRLKNSRQYFHCSQISAPPHCRSLLLTARGWILAKYFKDKVSRAHVPMEGNKWDIETFVPFFGILLWHRFVDFLWWWDVISIVVALHDRECDTSVTRDGGCRVLVTQWMDCDLWEVTLVASQTLWIVPDRKRGYLKNI